MRLIETILNNTEAKVLTPDTFLTDRGVRQGDAVSMTLFITIMDQIIKAHLKRLILNKSVQILVYADNVATLARDNYP